MTAHASGAFCLDASDGAVRARSVRGGLTATRMDCPPYTSIMKETDAMSEVLVAYEEGLVIITINRPAARNAVNRAVSYGVCAAIDALDAREDLRANLGKSSR